MPVSGVSTALKTVKTVLPRPRPHWVGDGFNVYPVFANKAFTKELSPFLMFDYAAPKYFPPTQKKLGVGEHPHRGFETVTMAFEGEVEHKDSAGNCGVIGPGDVQWMTAGRGIIHEEFHSGNFAKTGGTFEMYQLWVNLPKEHKMTAPRYQGILRDDIPSSPLYSWSKGAPEDVSACDTSEGSVRVVAGRFKDAVGPAKTWTQVDVWDVNIAKESTKEYVFDMVEDNNVIIFVRKGKVEVQGHKLGPQDVAIANLGGSKIVLQANEDDSKVLILAGKPIDEPIVAHGPMVMNTKQEINQAFVDFQSGNFGT
eukprot:CAMPEP_0177771042 /NCGR_PEP_ID=MMETSP0491_2-20121128/11315_1 /TAXON_ID=63592 /ORGANISM="Tetraselmis chuii, Strain PLY429" /LENGTH=310 /DNA_ID=CAMNT_0019288433 /DNA_START=256 /DNA_END=1188 /DNA_ORIENTATION=+